MLGPVARRVDHAQRHRADGDLVAVSERIVWVLDAGVRVDADRDAVLEREPAVAGDVVCVGVRLDDACDLDAPPLRLLMQRFDRERRVDDHRDPRLLVPHEIGGTAEIVVQKLVEDHGRERSSRIRYGS